MSKFVKRWVRPFFSSLQRIRGRRLSSLASSSAGLSKGGGGESGGGEIHVPVLIVGAGPVGLVLSLFLTKLGYFLNPRYQYSDNVHNDSEVRACTLDVIRRLARTVDERIEAEREMEPYRLRLGTYGEGEMQDVIMRLSPGIKCAVIEKSIAFSQHPQAHFINNRSMELFCKLDGLADDIQRLQPPLDLWRKFVYCTSLSGTILGSVDHMQPQDFEKLVSPISVAHFSQYKLTRLLLKKLENLGFHVCTPNGLGVKHDMAFEKKILMGHECISINPLAQGVKVGTSFLKDGEVLERNICCKILIGSDGSRSTVRKLMDIEMKGERDLQKLVSVHFLSRDLGQYLMHGRPGMLFFIFNPDAIGVLVAHDLSQGEFVLQVPFYPPQQKFEDFNSRVCEGIICKLVGWKLVDIQIVDVKPWVMHAEVAENFVAYDSQVILVGDAAHRFPPAGGFGMNTGIQDAHNLAWKIASLLHGISSNYILQTYEMERRPIALHNTALSIQNFKAAMSIPAALGLDPTVANTVHEVINSSICSLLPATVQKAVLEGIFAIGRVQISEYLLNESNPLGSSRLAKVRSILNEGKSLQLQFPAEDLGFRYLEGALVDNVTDGTQDTVEVTNRCRRESREYIPSAKPGSRLPHMRVRSLKAPGEKDTFSTLDLIPGDKLEFLLIIAPKKESYDLAHTAFKVAEEFGVFLKVCVMWPHGSFVDHPTGSKEALEPWNNHIDVEEVKPSLASLSWWDTCQITCDGAILVRPDEHTAWRATTKVDGNIVDEMKRIFSLILGAKRT